MLSNFSSNNKRTETEVNVQFNVYIVHHDLRVMGVIR
jgi:hypothetical protein